MRHKTCASLHKSTICTIVSSPSPHRGKILSTGMPLLANTSIVGSPFLTALHIRVFTFEGTFPLHIFVHSPLVFLGSYVPSFPFLLSNSNMHFAPWTLPYLCEATRWYHSECFRPFAHFLWPQLPLQWGVPLMLVSPNCGFLRSTIHERGYTLGLQKGVGRITAHLAALITTHLSRSVPPYHSLLPTLPLHNQLSSGHDWSPGVARIRCYFRLPDCGPWEIFPLKHCCSKLNDVGFETILQNFLASNVKLNEIKSLITTTKMA